MSEELVLTEALRDEIEATLVEVSRLLDDGHEFEAMEKAKAVCDTLDTLRQDDEVAEIRAFIDELTEDLLAA